MNGGILSLIIFMVIVSCFIIFSLFDAVSISDPSYRKQFKKLNGCTVEKYNKADVFVKQRILDNIELLETYEVAYSDSISEKYSVGFKNLIKHMGESFNSLSKNTKNRYLCIGKMHYYKRYFEDYKHFYVAEDTYDDTKISYKYNFQTSETFNRSKQYWKYARLTDDIISDLEGMSFVDFYKLFIEK